MVLVAQVGADPAVVLFALAVAALIGLAMYNLSRDPNKLIITPSPPLRKKQTPPPPYFDALSINAEKILDGSLESAVYKINGGDGTNVVAVVIPERYPFYEEYRSTECIPLWKRWAPSLNPSEWELPTLPKPGVYKFIVEKAAQSWKELEEAGCHHADPFCVLVFLEACRRASFNPVEDFLIRTGLSDADGRILCLGMIRKGIHMQITDNWIWAEQDKNQVAGYCSARVLS